MSKYLVIFFLLSLVGCAGNRQPEQSLSRVTLAQPLAFEQITGYGDTVFTEVRAVGILAPIGATYPAGSLWFELEPLKSGVSQWISANEIESWEKVPNQRYNLQVQPAKVQLRNGQIIYTRVLFPKFCPSAVKEVNYADPKVCLEVHDFLGARVDRRAYSALSSETTKLPVYSIEITSGKRTPVEAVKRVFIASEVSTEKAKLSDANKQYITNQGQQQETASARAREEDERRVKRIRSAKSGTTDNCTSVSLVPSGQPVGSTLTIRCGSLGTTSIQELKNSGWDVQISQRIPTQGMMTTADSVELAIRKK